MVDAAVTRSLPRDESTKKYAGDPKTGKPPQSGLEVFNKTS